MVGAASRASSPRRGAGQGAGPVRRCVRRGGARGVRGRGAGPGSPPRGRRRTLLPARPALLPRTLLLAPGGSGLRMGSRVLRFLSRRGAVRGLGGGISDTSSQLFHTLYWSLLCGCSCRSSEYLLFPRVGFSADCSWRCPG